MSLRYATIVDCFHCMAKTEVTTDWRTSKLVKKTLKACTCGNRVEDLSDPKSYAAVRTCQAPGCVNSCRLRFCLECSNARQADIERRRNATIKGTEGPMPKCACGVTLTHRLARTCRACKIAKNRNYQNVRNLERRLPLTPEDG
jgi:hypothetical protein